MVYDTVLVPAHAIASASYVCVLALLVIDVFRDGFSPYWYTLLFALLRTLTEIALLLVDSVLTESDGHVLTIVCGIIEIVSTMLLMFTLHKFLRLWHTSIVGTLRGSSSSSNDAGDNQSIASDMDGDGSSRLLRWTINGLRFLACIFAPIGIAGSIGHASNGGSSGFGLLLCYSWGYFVIFTLPSFLLRSYMKMSREWPQDLMAGKAKRSQLIRIIAANSLMATAMLCEALGNSIRSEPTAIVYLGMMRALGESTGLAMLVWPGFLRRIRASLLRPSALDHLTTEMAAVSSSASPDPATNHRATHSTSHAHQASATRSEVSTANSGSGTRPNGRARRPPPKLQLSEREKGGIHPLVGHDGTTIFGAGVAGGGDATFGGTDYNPFVISYEYKRKQEKQRRKMGCPTSLKSSTGLLFDASRAGTSHMPIPEERSYEQEVLLHQQRYAEQRRLFAELNRQQGERPFGEGYGHDGSPDEPRRQHARAPSQGSVYLHATSSQHSSVVSGSSKYSHNAASMRQQSSSRSPTTPSSSSRMSYF